MLDEETIDKYDKYGDYTYIGAWVLEVLAASIGLSIALLMVVRGLDQGGWNEVIAMAPMIGAAVMVAFAELTKIPLATLMLAPQGSITFLQRALAVFALPLMAFITFETVFQGMEQAQTVRQIEYQEVVEELANVRAEIALLESSDAQDRLGASQERLSSSLEGLEDRLEIIESQRQRQKDRILTNELPSELTAEKESLQSEADQLVNRLNKEQQDFDAWTAERQARYDDQKTSWEEQIKTYVTQGMQSEARAIQRKLDNFAHPRTKSDWRTRETEFLRVENEITARLEQINRRTDEIMSSARTNPTIVAALDSADREFDQQRVQIQDQIQQLQGDLLVVERELSSAATAVTAQTQQVTDLRSRERDLETERRKQARLDQLRRIAVSFSGDSDLKPEDVGDALVKSVGLVWFGSLSVLAALAGPITAIVALSLQGVSATARQKAKNPMIKAGKAPPKTASEKLWQTLRLLIVNWRWRRVDTRIQEREVTVPEYVYVPVPVDEPEELLKFLDNDWPDEVKAQVEGRVLGLKHAMDSVNDTIESENSVNQPEVDAVNSETVLPTENVQPEVTESASEDPVSETPDQSVSDEATLSHSNDSQKSGSKGTPGESA